MENVLTLIADPRGPRIGDDTIVAALDLLRTEAGDSGTPDWLAPGFACDIPFANADPAVIQVAAKSRLGAVDVIAQATTGRRKRLLVADMESTIIANEFIDELAELLGVGDEVKAITDKAVRGELDFAATLRDRVGMIRGLPVAVLEQAYGAVAVHPGAAELVATMRRHGALTALVSGGFSYFTSRVRDLVGFDRDHANVLGVDDGKLTGQLGDPIIDRAGKRLVLDDLVSELGIDRHAVLAVGDGANDLDMIEAAGMGVAYHAKPLVAATARARIDHGDLTAVLYIQGFRAAEIHV